MLLEEQPVRLVLVLGAALEPREHPPAVEFLPCEAELEGALGDVSFGIAHRCPGSRIPDDHGSAAVFPGGDQTLEVDIIDGVVFGRDCEPLVCRVERGPLGNSPTLEHTIEFEPEIVMVGGGVMLVNDETKRVLPLCAERLTGPRKIAFLSVTVELIRCHAQ
jgi:hypothetical protein